MRDIVVDSRYSGAHGIGRYAAEVIPRLNRAWRPLAQGGTPSAPGDWLNPARITLGAQDVLYSPGFGAGPSRATQIVTVHDLTHLRMPRGRRGALHRIYYERVLKPAIARAGRVITVSESSAEDIRDWLGDNRVEVHDAGNGCSPAFGRDGDVLLRPRPYFLYVGNLKPHKNPAPVFGALRHLPEHDLLVVSSDGEGARALAAQCGVTDRVHVLSGLDDQALASAYRGCSAFMFPSVMEGFGLPVVEAWKCGAPVVFYEGCAAVSAICGTEHFPVSSPTDPREWADRMLAASEARAHVSLLAGYDWDDVAAKVNAVLDRAMGGLDAV